MLKKTPLVIAHRGASAWLPENTLPAFRAAFEKFKADMIELDVHMSCDGVPVVIHDARLERTTNGTGYVSDHSFNKLKQLDAGFRFKFANNPVFPFRSQGIQIPSLEEIFFNFAKHFLAIEIKTKSDDLVRAVMRLIEKFDASSRVVVGSKHDSVSNALLNDYPHIDRFASQKDACALFDNFRRGSKKLNNDSKLIVSLPQRSFHIRLDSASWIHYLQQHKIRVFFWTINNPETAKTLCLKGVDGIISDDPGMLRKLFDVNRMAIPGP